MKIIRKLAPFSEPTALTIGNFDGIHLGHQTILDHVKQRAKAIGGKSVVVTFENHPLEVLRPNHPFFRLCTLEHKIKLLEEQNIDILVLLTFTQTFSEQSAESFLEKLRSYIPFSHLVLGHNASFGKDKQGDPKKIGQLAQKYHFEVEYLMPHSADGTTISSSRIRHLLEQGNLSATEKLLGRKYSIYSTSVRGQGIGTKIGFPTFNFDVAGLSLPPFGVYSVSIENCLGIANLGVAPTVKKDQKPLLEVHFFDALPKNSERMEITFHQFIRPEKKFDSLNALQSQIALDIQHVKN